MKRRHFIKGMLPMAMAPFALNGIPIKSMARGIMTSSFSCSEVSDRVLVIVQLHGGNDGLNTLIPLDQYNIYRNLRPFIGVLDTGLRQYVGLDNTLPSNQQIGLHPDLTALKSLYDDGKVNLIQDVAYTHMNGSHFRGSDTWLTGKDGNTMSESPDSGWFGRYLDHRFQNYPALYPNTDMPDPPGLEFGSHIVSLGFHREVGIPMGVTIGNDPSNLGALVAGVGGALPTTFPASDYGDELQFITEVEKTTNVYAPRITDLYNMGANTPGVVYPENYHTQAASQNKNELSPQLKTVARLLSGGSRTKVFLVRMGGFDTHEGQGIPDKPSSGSHGALLYHLAEGLKAFQDDLKGLGLEDRVMTVTFSEFGRQVAENGTYGTDHGTSAPMIVVGKGITPGITGINPNLSNLNNNKLVGYQYDYRQVFATIVQDWFGGNNGTLNEVEYYEWSNQKIDLINANYIDDLGNSIDFVADRTCDTTPDLPDLPPITTRIDPDIEAGTEMKAWPNPASDLVKVSFQVPELMPATLGIYDSLGSLVMEKELRLFSGTHTTEVDVSGLASGMYVLVLTANKGSRKALPMAKQKLMVE